MQRRTDGITGRVARTGRLHERFFAIRFNQSTAIETRDRWRARGSPEETVGPRIARSEAG